MDIWPSVFRYVLFATPIAILIIASFRYAKKEKGTAATLLFSGSTLAFLAFSSNTFFYTYSTMDLDNIEKLLLYDQLIAIFVIVGIAGMFLFAFGFLMFTRKYLKQQREIHDELDQIGKQ